MTKPLLDQHRKMIAYQAAELLAARYRELAADLLECADHLDHASVTDLLGAPVKYMHSGARLLEERLDQALVAL